MTEVDSPLPIRLGFEMMAKARFKHLSVVGLENLSLRPDHPKVLAATHTSDLDIPAIAAALSPHINLAFANISAQDMRRDPMTALLITLLGKENFFPLDYSKKHGEWQPGLFNPDNFIPMIDAMRKGKTILIAAHNPSYNFVLPKAGYGAVWLAHETSADIIPVAVDFSVKPVDIGRNNISTTASLLKNYPRLHAKIVIGEPITLDPFIDFSHMREESKTLMRAIALLLPPEKRGEWLVK